MAAAARAGAAASAAGFGCWWVVAMWVERGGVGFRWDLKIQGWEAVASLGIGGGRRPEFRRTEGG